MSATYASSEAKAQAKPGRLCTLAEAREFMRGVPLYPGKDLWAAVSDRDWVQVGNECHPPGTSHVQDLGEYPEHFDEGSEACTEVLLWLPVEVNSDVAPEMIQPQMVQPMAYAQPYAQQPGMMPMQQPGMMPMQQPGMMPYAQQPGMVPMQQPGMMPMQQPGMMPMQQPGMVPYAQQPGMMPMQQPGMMQPQMMMPMGSMMTMAPGQNVTVIHQVTTVQGAYAPLPTNGVSKGDAMARPEGETEGEAMRVFTGKNGGQLQVSASAEVHVDESADLSIAEGAVLVLQADAELYLEGEAELSVEEVSVLMRHAGGRASRLLCLRAWHPRGHAHAHALDWMHMHMASERPAWARARAWGRRARSLPPTCFPSPPPSPGLDAAA